jgi:hypothetical protein
MKVAEIIRKKELSQDEMLFVVEQYILVRKGASVSIKIGQGHVGVYDLSLADAAYTAAVNWFYKNPDKIPS